MTHLDSGATTVLVVSWRCFEQIHLRVNAVDIEITACVAGEGDYLQALQKLRQQVTSQLSKLDQTVEIMQHKIDAAAVFFGETPADDKAIENVFKNINLFVKSIAVE